MRRPLWHLLTAAMLLQLVLVFTADSTPGRILHAVSAVGLGIAARMSRPDHPPLLPRRDASTCRRNARRARAKGAFRRGRR